jgi:RNA polymerase sigma-70 factor (ECF subfamily)
MGEGGQQARWFTDAYAAHYDAVRRYCYRRIRDAGAAEELAQEVFLTAWRRGDRPHAVLPWLYGIARGILANRWRAQHRAAPTVPLPDSDGGDVAASAGAEESVPVRLDVEAALLSLAEADQEILRLIAWEQLDLAEAASVLGCRRATAAVRLHRARRRLLRALDPPPSTLPDNPTHRPAVGSQERS